MLRGRRTCGVPARPSRDRPTRMTLRGATSHEPASESTPLAQADPGQLLQDHRLPKPIRLCTARPGREGSVRPHPWT